MKIQFCILRNYKNNTKELNSETDSAKSGITLALPMRKTLRKTLPPIKKSNNDLNKIVKPKKSNKGAVEGKGTLKDGSSSSSLEKSSMFNGTRISKKVRTSESAITMSATPQ